MDWKWIAAGSTEIWGEKDEEEEDFGGVGWAMASSILMPLHGLDPVVATVPSVQRERESRVCFAISTSSRSYALDLRTDE